MPVICVNPSNSSDKEIVDGLSKQNEDLRLFLSDELEDSDDLDGSELDFEEYEYQEQ